MENEVLPLNKDTLSRLIEKYPKVRMSSQGILLNGPLQNILLVKFQSIDKEIIRKSAIRTKGGSGASSTNTDGWCIILTSSSFGTLSSDICWAFTNVFQKLCTDLVETHIIWAFASCRLIPLDKNPRI